MLRWMPIGLLDEEIDEIMRESVTYNGTGAVNYVKILQSQQYKDMKFIFDER
jgi:hypothetical protein